jgi:hypothetical protein
MIKFCKNCVFYQDRSMSITHPMTESPYRCMHPAYEEHTDMYYVNGLVNHPSCKEARNDANRCGARASGFEDASRPTEGSTIPVLESTMRAREKRKSFLTHFMGCVLGK